MSDNLVKISKLNRPVVESGQYTLTLLRDGCQVGIIDQEWINYTHNQILVLLKDTIIKYTRGESTSVKTEAAQHLLESLLYIIDAYMASFADPAEAIVALKKHGVKTAYNKGSQLVTACMEESRMRYRDIQAAKLVMGTHAYNLTIDQDLAAFFDNYEPLYSAQDTLASIDYPLLFDDMSLTGIFYIKQYLEKLDLENYFCRLFATCAVERLLARYGQVYAIDYRDTLLNLFEVVLTNAICSLMAGNKAGELGISQAQFELLQQRLQGSAPDDCANSIARATERLISSIPLPPSGLCTYIRKFIPVLMPRFRSGLQNDNLQNVMIVDQTVTRPPAIVWNQGQHLDDDGFRYLVEQLIDCISPAAKAALISSAVHSIEDFIDVLEGECLFEDEFSVLYGTLGDLELSILVRIVFLDEVRTAGPSFSLHQVLDESKEMEWQTALVKFLRRLSPARLDSIQALVASI